MIFVYDNSSVVSDSESQSFGDEGHNFLNLLPEILGHRKCSFVLQRGLSDEDLHKMLVSCRFAIGDFIFGNLQMIIRQSEMEWSTTVRCVVSTT